MASSGSWTDLSARAISGVAIAIVGLVAVLAGGVWFQMLAVFATAVMIWELWMMIRPDLPERGMMMAALSASVLSGLLGQDSVALIAMLFITPVIGTLWAWREKAAFFLFAMLIQLAGWGLILLRAEYGALWLIWLIVVVVATDVAGYFAGRMIGGPKFWPRVSPKKTWAGTVAGWIAAAIIGLVFAQIVGAGGGLVLVSVVLSFASQLGDIAESALKRRMGVKDSSALIPGHGGLFDRFDGLLGATLAVLVIALALHLPGAEF
ncbi:MAG: phosphatidate cytidylyltransferase [Rhodobacterales bacterium]|nr:MAG: phosphatidate cytidylyltransferase [Rhodobacterales bacterium]